MAFVPALPLTRATSTAAVTPLRMSASEQPQPAVTRRSVLAGAAAALAAAVVAAAPNGASAEVEYPNVGFLGGGEQIDINNANVRAYAKFRGFYPGLAGLIVANGPYDSVDDLYKLPGLTEAMKNTLDTYKENLVALKPTPEYELDKINNGLYR